MNYTIFVINLQRSIARWESISDNLSALGLSYERVEAIDGTELSESYVNRISPEKQCRRNYYRTLNRGEIGVALSHEYCWLKIRQRQLDFAIILEDDILATPEVHDVIETITLLQPGSWDYLKLFPSNKQSTANHADSLGVGHLDFVRYRKIPLGMCAQAVSYQGANRLLEAYTCIDQPIDSKFKRWWQLHIIPPIGIHPFPFVLNENLASTIDDVKPVATIPQSKMRKLWLKCITCVGKLLSLRQAKRDFRHFKQQNKLVGIDS